MTLIEASNSVGAQPLDEREREVDIIVFEFQLVCIKSKASDKLRLSNV